MRHEAIYTERVILDASRVREKERERMLQVETLLRTTCQEPPAKESKGSTLMLLITAIYHALRTRKK